MNLIGIMQGRLSNRPSSRLQSFPWKSWAEEFTYARQLQFDLIEWLFDDEDYKHNPIWMPEGLQEIRARIKESGVRVLTCCGNYFLAHPFFRVTEDQRQKSIQVLSQLIAQAGQLGIRTILLPVLEASEIRTPAEAGQLLESLQKPLEMAANLGVCLGLETELPAPDYVALIERAGHPFLGAYYDTGNHTAHGHDCVHDIKMLASCLVGVHIKDRKRGGPNVLLGLGDVDFDHFFPALRQTGYAGPVVLETTPGEDAIGNARKHLEFVRERLR